MLIFFSSRGHGSCSGILKYASLGLFGLVFDTWLSVTRLMGYLGCLASRWSLPVVSLFCDWQNSLLRLYLNVWVAKLAKIVWSQLACLVLWVFSVGWCNTTPTKNIQKIMQLSAVVLCSLLPQLEVSLVSITRKLQSLHEISWFAWLFGLVRVGFAVCKSTSPLKECVLFDSLSEQEKNWAALPHELFQD